MANFTFDLSDARKIIEEAAKEFTDDIECLKKNEAKYKTALKEMVRLSESYAYNMHDEFLELAKEALKDEHSK